MGYKEYLGENTDINNLKSLMKKKQSIVADILILQKEIDKVDKDIEKQKKAIQLKIKELNANRKRLEKKLK